MAVANDPDSALIGAGKQVVNFGPDSFNAAVNAGKTSLNGLTLLAESAGVTQGTFQGFRDSTPYNIDQLTPYSNQAEAGGAALANLGIGFGLAKYGDYAVQSPVIFAEPTAGVAYSSVIPGLPPIEGFQSPLVVSESAIPEFIEPEAKLSVPPAVRYIDSLDPQTAAAYDALDAQRTAVTRSPNQATGTNPNVTTNGYYSDGTVQSVTIDRTGVQVGYTPEGYPDFTPFLYNGPEGNANVVRIQMTGDRSADFDAANAAAGFQETPDGYTYHHSENLGVLQLVQSDVHAVVPHSGGVSVYNQFVKAGLLQGPLY